MTGVGPEARAVRADMSVRTVHAHLTDAEGTPVTEVREGDPIRIDALFETRRHLAAPHLTLEARNAQGTVVFGLTRDLQADVAEGESLRIAGTIENDLVPGAYSLDCWVRSEEEEGNLAVQGIRLLDFAVSGVAGHSGLITARADLQAAAEPRARS
jgi:hypothetical protein